MDERLKRFKLCDRRFFPYIEKVLARLPVEVKEKVLDEKSFQLIGLENFLTSDGLYMPFENSVKNMVYLSVDILNKQEYSIIHTIAHEIAHFIAGKGESRLFEKEAEDLSVEWGFEEEVNKVNYHRPFFESEGYEMGYNWAKEKDDSKLIDDFGEYLHDWEQDQLTSKRFNMLFSDVNPTDILREMGCYEESESYVDSIEEESPTIGDTHFIEKAIVWGVMKRIKEIQIGKLQNSNIDDDTKEFVQILDKIGNEFKKLFAHKDYGNYFEILVKNNIHQIRDNFKEAMEEIVSATGEKKVLDV